MPAAYANKLLAEGIFQNGMYSVHPKKKENRKWINGADRKLSNK